MKTVFLLGIVVLAACNRADPYILVETPPGQEDPRGRGKGLPPLTDWIPSTTDPVDPDGRPGAEDMAPSPGDMGAPSGGGTTLADAGTDAGSGSADGGQGGNSDGGQGGADGGASCNPQECQGVCYQNVCQPNGPTCPGFVAGACTYTQGYYRTHACWSLSYLTLGTTVYNQAELLSILVEMPQGNGLVALAHQLVAAKLNLANGATGAELAVMLSDSVIGSLVVPPVGSGYLDPVSVDDLVTELDNFNSGLSVSAHCE